MEQIVPKWGVSKIQVFYSNKVGYSRNQKHG